MTWLDGFLIGNATMLALLVVADHFAIPTYVAKVRATQRERRRVARARRSHGSR